MSHGVKILMLDGDRSRQSALHAALAEMSPGVTMLSAADGTTANGLARDQDPDVILLDIEMSEACAVCRSFKEDTGLATIPVLFLTTRQTGRDSRKKALQAGAEGFLQYPFDDIELGAQLLTMVKIKAAAAHRRQEREDLAGLVAERTFRLEHELAERKRAEIALSESEARFRRITEGLADYQYTVRLAGGEAVETVHSPACLFVTGYSAEEFAADPYLWLDMVTTDDREMLIDRVGQVLAGQDIGPIEHKIVRKDGIVRWVSDNIVLSRDAAGVLRSYDGIVKDITERKQVEATNEMLLRETQDRYHEIAALMRASRAVLESRDFAETARVIFAECRRQLEASAGFMTLRSEETGDIEVLYLDSSLAGGIRPDRMPLPVTGLRAEAYRAGRTIFTNRTLQGGDRDWVPGGKAAANMILAPLPVQGKVMGLIGLIDKPGGYTGEDARIATGFGEVAALALAQSRNLESLEQSELRFRSLIETASDAIISVDGEGRITQWNTGAEKIFGYTAKEAAGRNITLIVPAFMEEADGAPTDEPMGGRLQQSRESLEMAGQMKNGTWLPIELTVSRWQTREGVFFTVIIRDISERKQDEQAREKLQAQLNQAQKMEAIGVLAGGIAHDFNNILGAIIGYTEMAREDAGNRMPLADDLDKVLLAANRAKDLVKQILGFSRQSTVARIPMRILPLVKETLKMLRASIPTTISIKASLKPSGRVILADPSQVHQIVMNLCSNAAHAMESGGGVMTVAVKEQLLDKPVAFESGRLLPGEYIELSVSDTGTGIGPDVLARIFEPYFTTKEVGKGTGMGLSIIHGIIKSYGGAVTVDSVVGMGTTFRVYFPVVQEEEKTEELIPASPSGKERILFVDDEEVLTRMGKIMLERLGYTVTEYNSSLEALAVFMQDPDRFDLVITDQTMPGMTGTDLARRLLQLRPGLPIILCTGFSNLVNEESAQLLGIKGFVLKPLSKSVIGQLIRKVLQDTK